ncbi:MULTISPECIES: RNA-guided endonuclease TnpB family protein, partial [Spirulina sp. CCY15215]|uniref:RNA-guided endonuclease InsQ/TnpB family protein n=1 Tax=Spirulina sp. CCY15215 TaxID=2767591 RepID=UPI0019502C7D
MLQAVKVRLYPTLTQKEALSKSFGCARWYWNFALNACIQHYKETGKTLKLSAYKRMLPQLKKEYPWLKTDCYSAVLQCVAINLNKAYQNFFKGRAKLPKFKLKHRKQSIQYPQNVEIAGNYLKVPKIGEINSKFHRKLPEGKLKTVTISLTASGKYYASLLFEVEGEAATPSTDGKVAGIDLGIKDFAIVNDGEKTEKYANP